MSSQPFLPQVTTLPNGVRVVTESLGYVGSASIGVWCHTGSTHEQTHEAGITHFIEHMLFKGTSKRTSKQIAEEIEGRGGMLNAFTDKEQTCYYCRTLAEDAQVGLEVLTNMVTDATLDPEELEREKGVVLEEIKRSEDEPGDHVHELHLEGLWPTHALGLPVIGTPDSVSSFTRDHLKDYMTRRYTADNLLVAVAGNVEHEAIVDWASEHLGEAKKADPTGHLPRPQTKPGQNLVAKEVEQVHFCIGTEGFSQYDDEMYPAIILDAVLGGGMSSRLFQEVREKRGLVYSIGSYNMMYSSGGAFTIYGGTGLKNWEELQCVVRAELDKMISEGPSEDELAKVKKQISGNMVLGLEGMSSRMMRMAKHLLVHGRVIPLEETLTKLNEVTGRDIMNLAARILPESKMRVTAIGPFA